MIKAAADEIKGEFENTKNFTQEKKNGETSQLETQPDLSRISLHEKISGK
jgi:hypothetical protein